jgi:hypothetical protein
MSVAIHNRILKKRLILENKIVKINADLIQLQDNCTHPKLRYRYNGSSGNWDNDSFYWIECFCPSCKKRWTHDETSQEYLKINKIYPQIRSIERYSDDGLYKKFYEDWV